MYLHIFAITKRERSWRCENVVKYPFKCWTTLLKCGVSYAGQIVVGDRGPTFFSRSVFVRYSSNRERLLTDIFIWFSACVCCSFGSHDKNNRNICRALQLFRIFKFAFYMKVNVLSFLVLKRLWWTLISLLRVQ